MGASFQNSQSRGPYFKNTSKVTPLGASCFRFSRIVQGKEALHLLLCPVAYTIAAVECASVNPMNSDK